MNPDLYPHYAEWVTIQNARNAGFLLVGLLAVIGVAWLVNARFVFPRLLPAARLIIVVLFFGSLAASVATKLAGMW